MNSDQTAKALTDISNSHLLIVDDESDILDILAESLSSLTRNIHRASNGQESLEIIKGGNIDAVISDIQMPIKSGLEVLAEIRASGILVPYVIVTGFGNKSALVEALRLDATDLIDKPFQIDQIKKTMARALTFGVLQRQFEQEIENLYDCSNLPPDEIVKAKLHQKRLARMRVETRAMKKQPS